MVMNQELQKEKLGEPTLKIGGFQLWIHDRELTEANNYHEGWLLVTAHCGASGADVWVNGEIVMAADLFAFARQCQAMMQGDATFAEIAPFEPELYVRLESVDGIGHLIATIKITPNHLTQLHKFEFEIDQSYLPIIIKECSTILKEYPVRGD